MRTKYGFVTAVLVMIVLMLSCSIVGVRVVHANASWTFMVYMQDDINPSDRHSLHGAALANLAQMETVGSSSNVNIVVLDDEYNTNTQYYQVNSGSLTSRSDFPKLLPTPSDLDLSDANVLSTFVTWTAQQYSANNYALIMWDHAGGAPRGFLSDSGSGQDMTLQIMLQALKTANIHLSIIGFDACLMGMIETAYQMYKVSSNGLAPGDASMIPDFLVASEEDIPGAGWPYNTILSGLAANPTWTSTQFAESIVANYKTKYGSGSDTTLSAVDLRSTAFLNVMYDVYQLGGRLETVMGTYRSALTQAITDSTSERFPNTNPLDVWGYLDLYYLATNIKARISDSSVQTYCTNLQTDMGTLFPSARYWTDPNTHPNAHGLSIYMPPSYQSWVLDTYDSLRFSLGTWWNGMIRSYLGLFDFWITGLDNSQCSNVSPGSFCQIAVTSTLESGTSQQVDLSVNTIPINIGTTSYSSPTIYPTQSSTLTINIANGAPSGYVFAFVYAQQHGSNLVRMNIFYVQVSTGASMMTTETMRTYSEARLWRPGSTGWRMLNGGGSPDASALASSSSLLFYAAHGSDNGLYYRTMDSSGALSWWAVVPGGGTNVAPGFAVFNSRLYLVARSPVDSGIYYGYYPLSGGAVSGAFSGWSGVGGQTNLALYAAADSNYLYVCAIGLDGGIYHRRMSVSGVWSSWSMLPGGGTDVGTAITVFQNRLYFAAKGRGSTQMYYGYIDLSSYPSAWSNWVPLNGPTPDALELASSADYLYLAARGTDNGIYYRSMAASGTWSGWSVDVYGPTSSAVAVVVYDGVLYFAARGAGTNNLWLNSISFAKLADFAPLATVSRGVSEPSSTPFLGILVLVACCYLVLRVRLTTKRRVPVRTNL